jgi:ubiquinone/menaquinone biosynthesis C-methylase UbiE
MITVDIKTLDLPDHKRILDIGCGSGRHVAEAHALNNAMVVGVDPNIADLYEARDRLDVHERMQTGGDQSRWYLSSANILCLPFREQSFDLVICSEVLEHIHDYQRSIREIQRVLASDGQLVISVPRRWPEILCRLFSKSYRNTPGGHVRTYIAPHLIKKIESLGLRHTRTHWAHSLHTPFWWLKCLVGPERVDFPLVRLYHTLLVWDMMKHPRLTDCLDRWLNPFMGKSIVLYFSK